MLSTPLATSLCSSPFIPKITLTTVPHFSLLERAVFTKWHSHKRLWYFVLLKPGACFNHTFSFLSCFYLLFQLLSRACRRLTSAVILLVAVCVEECTEPVCHSQVLLLVAAAQETVAAAPPAVHSRCCCCHMCFLSLC